MPGQGTSAVEQLLAAVPEWARGDSRIVAAALVGSYARDEARPDSDIDLVLLADDPDALLGDLEWLARFGDVVSTQIDDYGIVRSRRVLYEDGREVEFGVAGREWIETPVDAGTARVMADGMRILYDPSGGLQAVFDATLAEGGTAPA